MFSQVNPLGANPISALRLNRYELFVTFIAFLIRERRWELLKTILEEPIPMRYMPREHGRGNGYWHYTSAHLPSIIDEARRKGCISLHADPLNERHASGGGLAAIMPMNELAPADYFLFLVAELPPERPREQYEWRPWSVLYLKGTPMFLLAGEQKQAAGEILKIFNISEAEEFKRRLRERTRRLIELFGDGLWHEPIRDEAITRFGTR
jgi:hypothetical protein